MWLLLALVASASLIAVATASAEEGIDVILAGGAGPDHIQVSLSADGTEYLIDSSSRLDGGGDVCSGLADQPGSLTCRASAVAGFEFKGGAGADTVLVSRDVPVPVTLRGGPDDDLLVGGSGPDLILGGPGEDVLLGGPGDDRLVGGAGDDLLVGGPGHDICIGGGGEDAAVGCEVEKGIAVDCVSTGELRSEGDTPCGRWGRRHPSAIERLAQVPR